MASTNEKTDTYKPAGFSRDFFAADEPSLNVEMVAATHPGKVRERNEDHYAVIRRTRSCEMLLTNLPADDVAFVDDRAYGILVADGVGGAKFGDFASQLVLETIFQSASLATNWLMKFKSLDAQEVQQRIDAYVSRIREAFREHTEVDPEKRVMGTTLTAAYLLPPHAIIAHIGDSRAYLARGGILTQITRDHTLAQAFIDAGANQEDVYKCRHILINSLDGIREEVVAEIMHVELVAGDRLLLCTDGLSDLVDAAQIASILSSNDLQTACNKLIESALDEGGKDNITVVLCDLSEPLSDEKS